MHNLSLFNTAAPARGDQTGDEQPLSVSGKVLEKVLEKVPDKVTDKPIYEKSIWDQGFETIALPDAEIAYAPRFLSISEADEHLDQIISRTPWEQSRLKMAGRECLIPRLNTWYGDSGAHYSYSGARLVLNPWTPQLMRLKQQVEEAVGVLFNSALLNYYRSGDDSVGWHSDDEPELGDKPLIAVLSIGAERGFDLRHKTQKGLRYTLDLEHGSLFVMAGAMQSHWAHRIAKTRHHCEARVSLTFRQVAGLK